MPPIVRPSGILSIILLEASPITLKVCPPKSESYLSLLKPQSCQMDVHEVILWSLKSLRSGLKDNCWGPRWINLNVLSCLSQMRVHTKQIYNPNKDITISIYSRILADSIRERSGQIINQNYLLLWYWHYIYDHIIICIFVNVTDFFIVFFCK